MNASLEGHARSPSVWLTEQVAELLEVAVEDVSMTEEWIDQGLDSVRLMTLLERLRAGGAELDFVELAERPTLEQWVELLEERLSVPEPAARARDAGSGEVR